MSLLSPGKVTPNTAPPLIRRFLWRLEILLMLSMEKLNVPQICKRGAASYDFKEGDAGWLKRSYLSGVRLGLGRLEERVGEFPHPHGHRLRHDGVFRVHHGVKKRLQVRLGVAPDVHDLVARWRVVLARIHTYTGDASKFTNKTNLGKSAKNKQKKKKKTSEGPQVLD